MDVRIHASSVTVSGSNPRAVAFVTRMLQNQGARIVARGGTCVNAVMLESDKKPTARLIVAAAFQGANCVTVVVSSVKRAEKPQTNTPQKKKKAGCSKNTVCQKPVRG